MLFNTNLSKEATILTKWLISIPSVAHAKGVSLISKAIYDGLCEFPYFKDHPQYIKLINHQDSPKNSVVALVKAFDEVSDTIVLLCDTDTNSPFHYGALKAFSTKSDELKEKLFLHEEELDLDVGFKEALNADQYLVGLGVLESKCASASMIVALKELSDQHVKLNTNILFVCTADSSIQHRGLKNCLPYIHELCQKENLKLRLALNAKPNLALHKQDEDLHIYTANYGKIEPSFYILGQSSSHHRPFSGFSASLIAAELIREIELNPKLTRTLHAKPLVPSFDSLKVKDFGKDFGPDGMQVSFSMPLLQIDIADLLEILKNVAANAIEKAATLVDEREATLAHLNHEEFIPSSKDAEVVSFSDLVERARYNYDGDLTNALESMIAKCKKEGLSTHQISITIIERLNELARLPRPSIVVYYTDNYVPRQAISADNSQDRELFMILDHMLNKFNEESEIKPTFAGYYAPSDAGFLRPEGLNQAVQTLKEECPCGLEDIKGLDVPTLTIGVKGGDLTLATEYVDRCMCQYLPAFILNVCESLNSEQSLIEKEQTEIDDFQKHLDDLGAKAETIASERIKEIQNATAQQKNSTNFYSQVSEGTLKPHNLDSILHQKSKLDHSHSMQLQEQLQKLREKNQGIDASKARKDVTQEQESTTNSVTEPTLNKPKKKSFLSLFGSRSTVKEHLDNSSETSLEEKQTTPLQEDDAQAKNKENTEAKSSVSSEILAKSKPLALKQDTPNSNELSQINNAEPNLEGFKPVTDNNQLNEQELSATINAKADELNKLNTLEADNNPQEQNISSLLEALQSQEQNTIGAPVTEDKEKVSTIITRSKDYVPSPLTIVPTPLIPSAESTPQTVVSKPQNIQNEQESSMQALASFDRLFAQTEQASAQESKNTHENAESKASSNAVESTLEVSANSEAHSKTNSSELSTSDTPQTTTREPQTTQQETSSNTHIDRSLEPPLPSQMEKITAQARALADNATSSLKKLFNFSKNKNTVEKTTDALEEIDVKHDMTARAQIKALQNVMQIDNDIHIAEAPQKEPEIGLVASSTPLNQPLSIDEAIKQASEIAEAVNQEEIAAIQEANAKQHQEKVQANTTLDDIDNSQANLENAPKASKTTRALPSLNQEELEEDSEKELDAYDILRQQRKNMAQMNYAKKIREASPKSKLNDLFARVENAMRSPRTTKDDDSLDYASTESTKIIRSFDNTYPPRKEFATQASEQRSVFSSTISNDEHALTINTPKDNNSQDNNLQDNSATPSQQSIEQLPELVTPTSEVSHDLPKSADLCEVKDTQELSENVDLQENSTKQDSAPAPQEEELDTQDNLNEPNNARSSLENVQDSSSLTKANEDVAPNTNIFSAFDKLNSNQDSFFSANTKQISTDLNNELNTNYKDVFEHKNLASLEKESHYKSNEADIPLANGVYANSIQVDSNLSDTLSTTLAQNQEQNQELNKEQNQEQNSELNFTKSELSDNTTSTSDSLVKEDTSSKVTSDTTSSDTTTAETTTSDDNLANSTVSGDPYEISTPVEPNDTILHTSSNTIISGYSSLRSKVEFNDANNANATEELHKAELNAHSSSLNYDNVSQLKETNTSLNKSEDTTTNVVANTLISSATNNVNNVVNESNENKENKDSNEIYTSLSNSSLPQDNLEQDSTTLVNTLENNTFTENTNIIRQAPINQKELTQAIELNDSTPNTLISTTDLTTSASNNSIKSEASSALNSALNYALNYEDSSNNSYVDSSVNSSIDSSVNNPIDTITQDSKDNARTSNTSDALQTFTNSSEQNNSLITETNSELSVKKDELTQLSETSSKTTTPSEDLHHLKDNVDNIDVASITAAETTIEDSVSFDSALDNSGLKDYVLAESVEATTKTISDSTLSTNNKDSVALSKENATLDELADADKEVSPKNEANREDTQTEQSSSSVDLSNTEQDLNYLNEDTLKQVQTNDAQLTTANGINSSDTLSTLNTTSLPQEQSEELAKEQTKVQLAEQTKEQASEVLPVQEQASDASSALEQAKVLPIENDGGKTSESVLVTNINTLNTNSTDTKELDEKNATKLDSVNLEEQNPQEHSQSLVVTSKVLQDTNTSSASIPDTDIITPKDTNTSISTTSNTSNTNNTNNTSNISTTNNTETTQGVPKTTKIEEKSKENSQKDYANETSNLNTDIENKQDSHADNPSAFAVLSSFSGKKISAEQAISGLVSLELENSFDDEEDTALDTVQNNSSAIEHKQNLQASSKLNEEIDLANSSDLANSIDSTLAKTKLTSDDLANKDNSTQEQYSSKQQKQSFINEQDFKQEQNKTATLDHEEKSQVVNTQDEELAFSKLDPVLAIAEMLDDISNEENLVAQEDLSIAQDIDLSLEDKDSSYKLETLHDPDTPPQKLTLTNITAEVTTEVQKDSVIASTKEYSQSSMQEQDQELKEETNSLAQVSVAFSNMEQAQLTTSSHELEQNSHDTALTNSLTTVVNNTLPSDNYKDVTTDNNHSATTTASSTASSTASTPASTTTTTTKSKPKGSYINFNHGDVVSYDPEELTASFSQSNKVQKEVLTTTVTTATTSTSAISAISAINVTNANSANNATTTADINDIETNPTNTEKALHDSPNTNNLGDHANALQQDNYLKQEQTKALTTDLASNLTTNLSTDLAQNLATPLTSETEKELALASHNNVSAPQDNLQDKKQDELTQTKLKSEQSSVKDSSKINATTLATKKLSTKASEQNEQDNNSLVNDSTFAFSREDNLTSIKKSSSVSKLGTKANDHTLSKTNSNALNNLKSSTNYRSNAQTSFTNSTSNKTSSISNKNSRLERSSAYSTTTLSGAPRVSSSQSNPVGVGNVHNFTKTSATTTTSSKFSLLAKTENTFGTSNSSSNMNSIGKNSASLRNNSFSAKTVGLSARGFNKNANTQASSVASNSSSLATSRSTSGLSSDNNLQDKNKISSLTKDSGVSKNSLNSSRSSLSLGLAKRESSISEQKNSNTSLSSSSTVTSNSARSNYKSSIASSSSGTNLSTNLNSSLNSSLSNRSATINSPSSSITNISSESGNSRTVRSYNPNLGSSIIKRDAIVRGQRITPEQANSTLHRAKVNPPTKATAIEGSTQALQRTSQSSMSSTLKRMREDETVPKTIVLRNKVDNK